MHFNVKVSLTQTTDWSFFYTLLQPCLPQEKKRGPTWTRAACRGFPVTDSHPDGLLQGQISCDYPLDVSHVTRPLFRKTPPRSVSSTVGRHPAADWLHCPQLLSSCCRAATCARTRTHNFCNSTRMWSMGPKARHVQQHYDHYSAFNLILWPDFTRFNLKFKYLIKHTCELLLEGIITIQSLFGALFIRKPYHCIY